MARLSEAVSKLEIAQETTMDHFSRMRGTALAALIAIGGLVIEGCATAQPTTDVTSAPAVAAPASAASAPAAVPAPEAAQATPPEQSAPATGAEEASASQGDVAELQRLMRDNEMSELRTSYNGSYGASLLLHADDMTYYAVLFQQKNFWRVVKTTNADRAEAIYADFARRSVELADVEIKRTVLAAQKAYTEQMLAQAQARADRLQADIDIARKQQALVATRQKQARDEAASLQSQKVAAQEQLNAMQQQIHLLQRETEQGLLPPPPPPRVHSPHARSHHRKH